MCRLNMVKIVFASLINVREHNCRFGNILLANIFLIVSLSTKRPKTQLKLDNSRKMYKGNGTDMGLRQF